jgi:predicted esterase
MPYHITANSLKNWQLLQNSPVQIISGNNNERDPMLSPKSRLFVFVGLALLWSSLVNGQTNESVPTNWSEIENAASALYEEDKFDEALALLEQTAPKLIDREFEISDLRMSLLFGAQRFDQAYDAWEKGLDEGFFYFVVPRSATYDAIRDDERFETALARNNLLRDKANRDSNPEYKVIPPLSYSPDESYPLVIVIHGGNQSIIKAMETWDPQVIGDDLLIAYAQSSTRSDTKSYRWDLNGSDYYHLPTAQNEVLELYQEILDQYPVDTEQVILVGFSQGGNLALNMAAEGTIPARGFLAGCPAIRNPVSPQTAQNAAARGLRGTIFVGANDWTAKASQTTVENFSAAGVPVNHIVMEGKGHEYPDNFEEVLRDAIKAIRQ